MHPLMTTPVPITAPVNQIHTFRHETNVLAKPMSGCDVRQREILFLFLPSVVEIESVTFSTLIYNFIIFLFISLPVFILFFFLFCSTQNKSFFTSTFTISSSYFTDWNFLCLHLTVYFFFYFDSEYLHFYNIFIYRVLNREFVDEIDFFLNYAL